LVEREDSIHIRIKIDVDEEDKEFTENLASNLAKTDEQQAVRKAREAGELSEEEQKEITRLKDEIKKINKEIRDKKPEDVESLKEKLKIAENSLELKRLRESPVSIVRDLTQEAAGNLRKFTTSPGQFFMAGLGKIFKKVGGAASKGGIIGIIALIVYEATLFALDEMMKPGRPLDRRFKRIAKLETMNFYERQLQEELRHGYAEIRVTTMQGLRGGQSQVNGNFFEFSSGATGIIQSSPYRSSQSIYQSQNANGIVTDSKGNPSRRSVSSTRYG